VFTATTGTPAATSTAIGCSGDTAPFTLCKKNWY